MPDARLVSYHAEPYRGQSVVENMVVAFNKLSVVWMFLCLVGTAVLARSSALAAPRNDLYIQQALDRYFPVPVDAPALALGGSSAPTCDGSSCLYQNPAGLGFSSLVDVTVSLEEANVSGHEFGSDRSIEQTENRGAVTALAPFGAGLGAPRYGALALGFSRYQGQTNDSLQSSPDGHRRSIGFGYAVNDGLALGYAFTFYDDQLRTRVSDLHSHARFLHVAGAQYRGAGGFRIGGTFGLGIGQSDTEDMQRLGDGLTRAREYRAGLGLSKAIDHLMVSFALDYAHVSSKGNLDQFSPGVVVGGDEHGDLFNVRVGLEMSLFPRLLCRVGTRLYEVADYQFEREDLRRLSGHVHSLGVSAGFGYELWRLPGFEQSAQMSYGVEYLTTGHGDWHHLVSLAVPLSL